MTALAARFVSYSESLDALRDVCLFTALGAFFKQSGAMGINFVLVSVILSGSVCCFVLEVLVKCEASKRTALPGASNSP